MNNLMIRGGQMKFQRLARGINPVRQHRGNKRAPVREGWWAFPWPHFDVYFAYQQYEDAMPSRLKIPSCDDEQARSDWIRDKAPAVVKRHTFWHPGPVYSVLSQWHEWTLLSIEDYAKALAKTCYYSGGGKFQLDTDLAEVFIPAHTSRG